MIIIMKPGEVITRNEEIELNKDSKVTKIKISNAGDLSLIHI